MRLGTRWVFGAETPSRLPEAVVAAIREVEESAESPESGSRYWTLTWLEGRPIVELDPERGKDVVTTIRFDPSTGTATIAKTGSGEEWVEDEL